eukprot:CCRYP_005558-RA/>CCRYP_005558-RA protein AED:0.01 eAED:0.01 QI:0/0/0/1/1/1/2/0/1064
MTSSTATTSPPTTRSRGYIITGRAAHERIARLFSTLLQEQNHPQDDDDDDDMTNPWVDLSPYAERVEGTASSTTNTNTSTTTTTTTSVQRHQIQPDAEPSVVFLWENSTRNNTKSLRDTVQVYSHLPNGTAILDDKWVLARLLGDGNDDEEECRAGGKSTATKERKQIPPQSWSRNDLATLESHCFRGSDFYTFVQRVGLLTTDKDDASDKQHEFHRSSSANNDPVPKERHYKFDDLMDSFVSEEGTNGSIIITTTVPPPTPSNLWVVKDAMSNGAGGIWIVDRNNISEFLDDNDDDQEEPCTSSILHPTHRYIAQRYAWPPTLAFLHVANDSFEYVSNAPGGGTEGGCTRFEPSVHITNCCANSHDVGKFAGEICADLTKVCGAVDAVGKTEEEVPLGKYFPSISASVAALAQRSAPFLRGGQANHGFEYLGMDFVLSSSVSQSDSDESERIPVAYLLEVNAPPSQDTATGLSHAEALHDEVITDLLRMCVLPELGIASREYGGWICVYKPENKDDTFDGNAVVVPSKAAFVNRVRWAMFERKAAKEYERKWCGINQDTSGSKCESPTDSLDHHAFVRFVRSQFPYFSSLHDRSSGTVFLESGGGAQVPRVVMDSVVASLSSRDRSVLGAECQQKARHALLSLLTGEEEEPNVDSRNDNILIMGPNATSLLENLAQQYYGGMLTEGDEIIIASENHLANVLSWIALAKKIGAQVKWWTVTDTKKDARSDKTSQHVTESPVLSDLITSKTKVVAVSQASNILGCVRNISSICQLVHHKTKNQAQVVVDGVAAAPHLLSLDVFQVTDPSMRPDFYVVSLHKLFGPHMGCVIAKKRSLLNLLQVPSESDAALYKLLERGTMNYEACAGACALYNYFLIIANESRKLMTIGSEKVPLEKGLTYGCQSMGHTIKSKGGPSSSLLQHTKYDVSLMHTAKVAIQNFETLLVNRLLHRLQQSSSFLRIIQDPGHQHVCNQVNNADDDQAIFRLPTVCFVHSNIQSSRIVQHCRSHGVVCRACRFLSTDRFWKEMGIGDSDVVRFSLAHYNTTNDVDRAIEVLEMFDDWDTN